MLLRKLPLLDGWNERAARAAAVYTEALAGVGDLVLPPVAAGSEPVWHLFVVRTRDRDALAAFLAERGHRHRPPLPGAGRTSRRRIAHLGYRAGAFPVAERLAARVPLAPDLPGHHASAQLEQVVEAVADFFAVADRPVNDAPYRLIDDVEFGEGVVVQLVHEPLRLPDRRRDADRHRSSRSSAAP